MPGGGFVRLAVREEFGPENPPEVPGEVMAYPRPSKRMTVAAGLRGDTRAVD